MKSKDKVSIITLGCSKNTVDSERLKRQLALNDFEQIDDPNQADTVVINTCGFIEAAKEESVNTILEAVEMKKRGLLKKVVVAGCLSERYLDDLKKEIPEVDSYFGTEAYEGIITDLGGEYKYELLGERELLTPKHYAYLKISEGCDNPCSFCAIPLMRGKHVSKDIDSLVRETEMLADKGVKELLIIGQDTSDYGKDIYGKRNIAELLNKLSEVKGIEWIKMLYAYPSHFPDDLISTINDNPVICNYIDLPLQHISDNVLKSMRRGITERRTRELVEKMKSGINNLTLRTTFITGYPAEGDKEHKELLQFIKDYEFDRVGVFTYSPEDNTSAFILEDPVSDEIKLERQSEIMEIQKDISFAKNNSFIGSKLKVIVDDIADDFYVARSARDVPEVDGEVLIHAENNLLKIGNFYEVEIIDNNDYDLFAKV